jgi:hypothetical protein
MGVVTAKDGGESAGSFAVNSASHGAFVAVKPAVDPGSPAVFSATGAKPNADKSTVIAEVIATSRAGRALGSWFADGDDVKVQNSFGGWIEATTSGSGLKYEFDVFANFNLTSVNTGPNSSERSTEPFRLSRASDLSQYGQKLTLERDLSSRSVWLEGFPTADTAVDEYCCALRARNRSCH